MEKIAGTIQVDLDDFWVIAGAQGYSVNLDKCSFFESALNRFLDLFDEFKIKATFFVVARDLILDEKRKAVLQAFQRGHEIANHSLNHRPYFQKLSSSLKKQEILTAESIIVSKIGCRLSGFKAPNYNFSMELADILKENNYLYDSSLLATPYSGLLSFIRRKHVKVYEKKMAYLSSGKYGFASLSPFLLGISEDKNNKLYEFGVSTAPLLRLPFHSSYILALERWGVGWEFFKLGLKFSAYKKLNLNYSFHLCDLADQMEHAYLPKFQMLQYPLDKRQNLIRAILQKITKNYIIFPTKEMLTNGIKR